MHPSAGSSSRVRMTAPAASPNRIDTLRSSKSQTVLMASQPTTATVSYCPYRTRVSARLML